MSQSSESDLSWHDRHRQQAAVMHAEELVNCLTHGVGLLIGLAGVVVLLSTVVARGEPLQVLACAVYAASLLAVYAASTLSHAFHHTRWRRLFRTIDQASIFLLIAASFTPFALTYLRTGMWWLLVASMWVVALAGFASKAFFSHNIESVTTRLHLLLGWMPIVALKPLVTRAPLGLLMWLLAGGFCYSVGTLFLMRDHIRYYHAIWHLLVIAGSLCHFVAILIYCTTAPA